MLNEVTDEVTKPASGISPLKKDIEALNERVTEVENNLTLYKEHQEEVTNTVVLNSTEVHSKSIDADTASFGSETVSSLEASNATINNANISSINGTVGIDKAIIGELELTHPELERLDVGSLHAEELDTEHLAINELTVNKITSDVVMQDISAGEINSEAVITEDIETSSIESESIHNEGLLSTGNVVVDEDIEVGDRVSARDVQAEQAEVGTLDVLTIKNSKNTRNEKSFINLSPALQTIDDFYVVKVPNTKGFIQMEASDGCWNMTVIKNGKNVIVAYSEESLDKIPAIRYTENGEVYFSIKCDGQINYVFDVNDVPDTPELDITYTYNEWPEEGTDFIPTSLQRTVIMGNNTVDCGLTVMGQLDYKIGPEEVEALINNLNLKGMLRFVNSEGITEEGSQGYYVSSDDNGEPHWTEPSDALPDAEGEVVLSTEIDRLVTERKLALWNGKSYYGRETVNNLTKLGEVTEGTWKAGEIDTPELTADVARVEEIFSPKANIDEVSAESVLTDDINGVIDFTTEKGTVVIRENVEVTGDLKVDGVLTGTTEKALKDANGEVITATYARLDKVGAANGIASLGPSGTLPLEQLPTEAIVFKGMWNASTNTPRLADGTGTSGDYYIVSVGGTVNFGSGNITFVAGDGVIYDGSKWHRKADTNLVQSVNGQTGNVTIRDIAGNAATATTAATATKATQDGNGNNIVNTYATKSMLNNRINSAVCDTFTTTAAKVVNIDGFVLKTGVTVSVMFTFGNSVNNPTLNVSGTGAKDIKVVRADNKVVPPRHTGKWRNNSTTSNEMWQNYTTLDFIYDGTDWVIIGNPVVESYYSSNHSYEIKADGLMEQWGSTTETVQAVVVYNLPFLEFCCVTVENKANSSSGSGGYLGTYINKNYTGVTEKTGFRVVADQSFGNAGFDWRAIGY